MTDYENLICCRCNSPLVRRKVKFEYMGYDFSHELPSCPSCGQVFIPESLAKGRIADVEINLEDK